MLTDRQHERLESLFAGDRHIQVECTWGIYQRLISAYRHPDRTAGRVEMSSVINALADGVPTATAVIARFEGPWSDLPEGGCRLEVRHQPVRP